MEKLLEKYQKVLNLTNWEIQLLEEEGLETDGKAKMFYNDYRAIIYINKELNDIEKEKTLIHELLHLIHRDELDIVDAQIKDENIYNLYNRFHERAIEQMAKIIFKLTR